MSNIKEVDITLNRDYCPGVFCNPFQSDMVQDIDITISKRFATIQKGYPIKATVRMQNNETIGLQYFYGDNLMNVVQQIDAFIQKLK